MVHKISIPRGKLMQEGGVAATTETPDTLLQKSAKAVPWSALEMARRLACPKSVHSGSY